MLRIGILVGLVALTSCAPTTAAAPPIPGSCPAEVASAVVETIRAQQQAFARADFTRARSYASSSFQANVDPDQFTDIIQSRYAFLLTDPTLEFTRCELLRSTARITVRVRTSPEQLMAYRVVPEGEAWRIDGATTAESTAVSA